MNVQFQQPKLPRTSQAAEGLERWRWTVAEVEALIAAGIIGEDERFELIGGEIVPMSPKGNLHELLKISLNRFWHKLLPETIWLAPETTFRLSTDTFLEPDFVFYSAESGLPNLNGDNALMAVEIAYSSLGYDLGRKARLYAVHNIRELWVINVARMVTTIHRRPGLDGYAEIFEVAAIEFATPVFAAGLAVKLADLKLV